MKCTRLAVFAASLILVVSSHLVSAADNGTTAALAKSNLKLVAPIDLWDEAVPLGNGRSGGLLWGGGHNIKLSLDRGDIWDCRQPEIVKRPDWNYATLCRLVAEKNYAKMIEMFEFAKPALPYPTKLPAGRIELTLDESHSIKSFGLDLPTATGSADLADGTPIEAFFIAAEPVAMMRVPGDKTIGLKIIAPTALRQLGYKPAALGEKTTGSTQFKWFVQDAADNVQYVVAVGSRKIGGATVIATCVTTRGDGPEPLTIAQKRIVAALDAGWDATRREHLAWWERFWSKSSVQLPDAAIQ